METIPRPPVTGWIIGESIPLELDIAIAAVAGVFTEKILPADLAVLLLSVPAEWKNELLDMLGEIKSIPSILETSASLCGVLLDGDYSHATLKMRELTIEAAVEQLSSQAISLGIEVNPSLRPAERLEELNLKIFIQTYQSLGFSLTQANFLVSQRRHDLAFLARILNGGDLHARFWHWMDRLYFELYRSWRQSRSEMIETLIRQASTVLGAREKVGVPPHTSWLPAQNPILRYPELHSAVSEGLVQVYFVAEPYGMTDLWDLLPGLLLCTFAEPGMLFENFRTYAADVATRAQALADPTRLIILRIIRHFSMVNTEIAAYLGLARPTVSIHAKILREAGLIRSYPEGRLVRHEIVPSEVRRLFRDLEEFLDLPPEV